MPDKVIWENHVDGEGMPSGGKVRGIGMDIDWQKGPLVIDGKRRVQNGAFVEDVLKAVIQRVKHYQVVAEGKFACRENALAITHMEEALHWMQHRQAEREGRGVAGTHEA